MKQFAFEFSNKTNELEKSVSTFDIKWRQQNKDKTWWGKLQLNTISIYQFINYLVLLNLINLKVYLIYLESLFGNSINKVPKNVSKIEMQKHQNENFQKVSMFLDQMDKTYKTLDKNLKDYQSNCNLGYFVIN